MAHAALVASREGLRYRKFEDLSKDDACKGIKVAAAFTAVYSGLCGYFEPDPNDVMYAVGGQVLYIGRAALSPPPGHVSELDTSDPLFSLLDPAGRVRPVYIGVDLPAQDTRDMLATEMVEAMDLATTSAKGTKWLATCCTSDMISKALTLMVATKFNWYQTNHHVRQGHAFIHKIASTMCPWMQSSENSITEVAKNTIWEIGHWVSTHLCLNLMGMRTGIRVIASPCGFPVGTAILADDKKIRCDAAPAGMAKTALVHATMQLHHKNVLWLVAPGFDKILKCVSDVNAAKLENRVYPRVKNHEGRIYLTGKSEKTRIMDMIVPL